jgi:hypothetical protein
MRVCPILSVRRVTYDGLRHTEPVPDTTPPSHAHHEPPGPPVKWETVSREWDRSGRLLSERVTTTEDADCEQPEPERLTGFYL